LREISPQILNKRIYIYASSWKMPEGAVKFAKVLVTSAWPYINVIPHLGNLVGSVLSADVAARYYRLRGDGVLMVSGSDEHGTPIEVEAMKQGIAPKKLTDRNHARVADLFRKWDISFDNLNKTYSISHIKNVQDFSQKTNKFNITEIRLNDEGKRTNSSPSGFAAPRWEWLAWVLFPCLS